MRTDRLLRLGFLTTLITGGLGSAGCSTMNNTEKGAAVGGVGGAAVGTAIGAATGRPLLGAAVGGLAGTAGGALVGNDIDRSEQHQRDVQQAQAVASAQAQAQAQQRVLGMADIIRLSQQKLDDQVIINQIHTTGSTFQLTTSDLEMLQANGVSPQVIAAMQAARPVPGVTPVVVGQPGPTVIYGGPPVVAAPAVVVAPRPYYYYGGGYYRRGW